MSCPGAGWTDTEGHWHAWADDEAAPVRAEEIEYPGLRDEPAAVSKPRASRKRTGAILSAVAGVVAVAITIPLVFSSGARRLPEDLPAQTVDNVAVAAMGSAATFTMTFVGSPATAAGALEAVEPAVTVAPNGETQSGGDLDGQYEWVGERMYFRGTIF